MAIEFYDEFKRTQKKTLILKKNIANSSWYGGGF
jgi:hypothetical protein